jgi:hypothetical protein
LGFFQYFELVSLFLRFRWINALTRCSVPK